MNPSRLTRRLVAGATGLLIGAAGALAVASPAAAHHTEVTGVAECVAETGEWSVTWTVTSKSTPEGVTHFQLTEVNHEPAGTILNGLPTGVEQPIETAFTGEQRLPADATSAALSVKAQWDNGKRSRDYGEVWFEGSCDQPEPPAPSGEWEFDCETLTISLTNPSTEELALTLVPSTGEPAELAIPAGESATVEFPASEGLAVEVRHRDELVALEQPIEITAEAWAEQGCAEDEDEGEGGGLPETGAPTALIAGGAVGLLALGTGLFLVARRRRVTFTAS